jgi:hypothetical protein
MLQEKTERRVEGQGNLIGKCLLCKKTFKYYLRSGNRKATYCSIKCSYIGRIGRKIKQDYKGNKNPNWNGGIKRKPNGYILIYSPNHPKAIGGQYVYEHRLVMEKHIGRYLTDNEVVHHINKNTSDNRIDNLMLFKNNAEHLRFELGGKNVSRNVKD